MCVILALLASFTGCGGSEMDSHWRTKPITIDGTNTEWQDAMVQVEDAHGMIGIVNDSSYLYLSLLTDDPGVQRQVMFRGLTVWIDPRGGKDKMYGVRYPVAMQYSGYARRTGETGDGETSDGQYGSRPGFDSTDVELLGPGEGEHRMMTTVQLQQFAVKARDAGGVLTYELRIPLSHTSDKPDAPDIHPGSTIGIGLEAGGAPGTGGAGEAPRGESSGGMGRGGRGGGRHGGGGGGGRGGGSNASEHKPVELWITAKLAVHGGATPP
jgi:hypothetical protein